MMRMAVAMGVAGIVKPCFLVDTHGVDNQGIALPPPHGVPEPRRLNDVWQRAPIREDLSVRVIAFEQHHEHSGGCG